MAQPQQQQQRLSPREEMLRAMQAAGQSDRDPHLATDAEALVYAAGVKTGQIDPLKSLTEQDSRVIDLTGYGGRSGQPRLIVG